MEIQKIKKKKDLKVIDKGREERERESYEFTKKRFWSFEDKNRENYFIHFFSGYLREKKKKMPNPRSEFISSTFF